MTATPLPHALRLAIASLLFLAGTLALADRAQACSIKPSPDTFNTSPSVATTPAPAAPTSAKIVVTRSKYAGPGTGDCGDVGSIKLDFELAGAAWPDTLGIRLRVVGGTVPRMLTLPEVPLKVVAGSLAFTGSDDPALPIDVTLQATTVDATNTESTPITIHILSAGNGSDGGCSFSPHAKVTPVFVLFLLGTILLARTKNRPCSTK